MVDPIVTSRRGFLKGLGASTALLAVPVPFGSTSPVVQPSQKLLPPSILHVWDGASWQAILGVRDVTIPKAEILSFDLLDSHPPGRTKGVASAGELEFEGIAKLGAIRDLFVYPKPRRFALSSAGEVREFEAYALNFCTSVSAQDVPYARIGLGMNSAISTREIL